MPLKPYIPLRLTSCRRTRFARPAKSLGEHLRNKRLEQRLIQREVAKTLSVSTWTYILWETDRRKPTIRYYPSVLAFLGYDPFAAPATLPERIASKRRELGLPIAEAAKLIGVDEGTFRRWEDGSWKPRMSGHAVEKFLSLSAERLPEG